MNSDEFLIKLLGQFDNHPNAIIMRDKLANWPTKIVLIVDDDKELKNSIEEKLIPCDFFDITIPNDNLIMVIVPSEEDSILFQLSFNATIPDENFYALIAQTYFA
ncbi:MAG: hypothetical protein WC284_08765 [Candidimonas sp.]